MFFRNRRPHSTVSGIARSAAALALVFLGSVAQAQFTDDFARANGADLGNGWIEKNPLAFSLAGGSAEKQAVGLSYVDNIAYRPASEDLLDAEAAVEFQLSGGQVGYPQVFTRVQSSTAAIPGFLDGYILYLNNNTTTAILGRQTGAFFVTSLASINISPALNNTDRYRMRLRSTGAFPVNLAAFIDRWNGSGWDVIGQATAIDSDATAHTTPGSVGFSGYIEAGYSFDNVSVTNLGGASNPLPVLGSIAPNSATEGGSAFSLTVNGSDFLPGSTVRWNGADRATTYVSATELQAAITAGDIANAGTATVTVFNPAPGGGTSAGQTFTIDADNSNPAPTLNTIAPNAATEGGSAFTLTVNGADFVPGSVVRWNGANRTTTFVSANQLQANITAADIATAGTANVTVFNPAPGGGTSAAQTFTIDVDNGNPIPALVNIAPDSATEGGSAFNLTVTGNNFVAGSIVRWNGADRATTFVSAGELQAAITAADIAAAGSASVTVFNPAPGGGTSAVQTFTINPDTSNNPAPTITSLNPNAATEGGSAFTLTVNGTGLIPGSVVRWNGNARTTTFVSTNQVQAAITAADIATSGTASVTVFNPAPGGGTSAAQTFSIQAVGEGFFDNFERANNADLNNGWIEKNPEAFSIVNGTATKQPAGLGYRDNVAYRPASENLLDVEASMEIRLSDNAPGYPQLFTRLQSATVAQANILDGYILYINNNNSQAILGRQTGPNFVASLASINLNPALNTTDLFRLRLRSTGAFPVSLAAFVERWNGSGWDVIGQASTIDSDGNAIQTAGAAGFGGYVEASYSYDNFTTTDLGGGGGSNPLPALTSIAPNNATEGGSAFTLTVNGSNFIPGSVVRWNGGDRTTTYVSPTELQAAISSADIAAAGTANVTVFNPGPGGGTSAAQTFTIDPDASGNPIPTLTTIAPNSATEGGSGFTMTINGNNFIAGSVVRWNGANRATTFLSANQLQATITAGDIAVAGTADVTVFNPGPGGGTSGAQTFTIDPDVSGNPTPTLNAITPNTATEGGSAFTLTVNGANFIATSVVRWDGADRATTFVSANQLQATITAGDIANAGTANVTVFTPAPGGGTSVGQVFTIESDGPPPSGQPPIIESTSPENVQAGSGATVITVLGSGFSAQTVAHWNGSPRPTTFVSSQVIDVTLNANDVLSATVGTLALQDPNAPGVFSDPYPFFVLDASGSYFFDNFNTPDSGALGNNWTEKTPEVFAIENDAVTSIWFDRTYRDNLTYRPAGEDRQDVEVVTEFVRRPDGQFSQLHARATRSTVATPNFLESYIFYIEDNFASPGAMAIAVNPPILAMGECIIEVANFPEPLQVGDRYRMRFLVTGEDPVRLEGFVDRYNTAQGTWDSFLSMLTFHDDTTVPSGFFCAPGFMPDPIPAAGAVGMAKWVNPADEYDNFYWLDIAGQAGIPSMTSATPNPVTAGGPQFTLTVDGANFTQNSIVRWNGSNRATTYVDSTTLQATITAADIAAISDADVNVFTPAPGGGLSNTVIVNVVDENSVPNPLPTIATALPRVMNVGQGTTQVTVNGTGFTASSQAAWNGANRTIGFISDTQVTVTIPASDLASAGTAALTISNPTPGGGVSAPASIEVVPAGSFTDDFARPNSSDPGNGWIEKSPAAFSITDGVLVKNFSAAYRDNPMYRPVAESMLDSTVSTEFVLNDPVPGYPQIFSRLQPATSAVSNTLDAYMLYLNNGNLAILGRQTGPNFVEPLDYITLTEGLAVGTTYRLRLETSGTSPVALTAYVERLSPNGYVVIGQGSANDAAANRIQGAGVGGVGGHSENAYSFDNVLIIDQD